MVPVWPAERGKRVGLESWTASPTNGGGCRRMQVEFGERRPGGEVVGREDEAKSNGDVKGNGNKFLAPFFFFIGEKDLVNDCDE